MASRVLENRARSMRGITRAGWTVRLFIALALVAALIATAAVATPIVVRRWVVPTMNAQLQGYELRIASAHLRLLHAGVALEEVAIVQHATIEESPDRPLATVPRVIAGLDLPGIFQGRLGLVVRADGANLDLTANRIEAEWNDPVLFFDKGWVEGFNAVSPLPINRLYARSASMTYVHRPKDPPLRIEDATLEATDLARDGDAGTFPSRLRLRAHLPSGGRLDMRGAANVTHPNRPTVDAEFKMEDARVDTVQALLRPINVIVTGGNAAADGRLTATWEHQRAHVQRMRIDKLAADYIHTKSPPRVETVVRVARELAQRPIDLRIDELLVRDATVGLVDETTDARYRVAVTSADVTLRNFSTEHDGEASLIATGAVMGSGSARIEAKFPARWRKPEGELTLRMRDVQIRRLNDALRALLSLDVSRGQMSLDSSLELDGGILRGRMEPRISNLEVHDESQDAGEGIVQQTYEAVVGAVAGVFTGGDETASVDASFDVEPARVDTWGEALYALREAWGNKLRTAVRIAASDPLKKGADGE